MWNTCKLAGVSIRNVTPEAKCVLYRIDFLSLLKFLSLSEQHFSSFDFSPVYDAEFSENSFCPISCEIQVLRT